MWYFGGTLHKAETLLSTVVWHPLSVSVLLNIATPACSPYWGWFMEWVVNRCVKELSLMMTQSASCGESLTQSLTAAPILIGCQASSHTSHTTSSYFNAISHIYWPSCDIIKSHSCRDLAHNVSVTWNGRHAVTLSQCHACNGRRDPSPSWLAKAWSLSRSHRERSDYTDCPTAVTLREALTTWLRFLRRCHRASVFDDCGVNWTVVKHDGVMPADR